MLGSNLITPNKKISFLDHDTMPRNAPRHRLQTQNTVPICRRDSDFASFVSSILPPPPDKRNVVLKEQNPASLPDWATTDVPPAPQEFRVETQQQQQQKIKKMGAATIAETGRKVEISSANTTLILVIISPRCSQNSN